MHYAKIIESRQEFYPEKPVKGTHRLWKSLRSKGWSEFTEISVLYFSLVSRKLKWLKKPTTAKCLCFVPLDADFMAIPVQTACVPYATKNIFNGRMVVMVELAPQVSINCRWCLTWLPVSRYSGFAKCFFDSPKQVWWKMYQANWLSCFFLWLLIFKVGNEWESAWMHLVLTMTNCIGFVVPPYELWYSFKCNNTQKSVNTNIFCQYNYSSCHSCSWCLFLVKYNQIRVSWCLNTV